MSLESFAASGPGWHLSIHITRADLARMTPEQRRIVNAGLRAILIALSGLPTADEHELAAVDGIHGMAVEAEQREPTRST